MPTDADLAQIELERAQEPSQPGGQPSPEPKKEPYGAFGVGESATAALRERLLEQRAKGVIFRDVDNNGPTDLSRQGPPPKTLNPWQTGESQKYNGLEAPVERFPEELPKGAIGWDDNGNPFYGGSTPFQEWQLRAHANLERSDQITEEEASWDDWQAPKIGEQEGIVEKGKAVLAGIFEAYEQTSESVDYILAGGDEEVNRLQTGWRQLSHYGGETLQRLGSLAYQTKLFFGGVAHLAEEKFQIGVGVGDSPVHFTERNEQLRLASDQFAVAPAHDDVFWRRLGVSRDTIDEYKQGALAGRMFYTTVWDNTVDRIRGISGTGQAGNMKKEEFMREMADNPNANPNLVVKKYENPAAEMWGEIIFDPLNVFEWGAKSVTAAAMVAKATKFFAEPASNVGRFLKASKLTRVSGLVDEAQDAAKIAGLVDARMLDVAQIAKADTKLAKSKAFWQLTNSAKAHVAAQDIGQVTQWAWRMARTSDGKFDVDAFIKIQEAIMKTAGDPTYLRLLDEGGEITAEVLAKNKSVIQQGLNELNRFPGYDIAFTEPGTRAALMMQDTWKNGKKLRKALASDKDPTKALQALFDTSDEIIEKATKKFFPDIIDDAYDAKGGWKVIAKTHKYMQDGPYKLFNRFFSSIYLGLNPGFAARNFMQNTIQGVLDEGVRGVIGFNTLDNITTWGADVTPLGAISELGTMAAGEKVTLKSKIFIGTNWASAAEKTAGLKIYGRIYPKTMKKLFKEGLSFKNLRKYGLDKDQSNHILAKMIEYKGDYNKVFDDLILDAKKGYYEVAHDTLTWSDEMIAWADETGIQDAILNIMKTSESPDAAKLQIKKIFQDGWDAGDGVIDDIPVLKAEDVATGEMSTRANMINQFGGKHMKEDQLELNHYFGVNTNVWTSGKETATNFKTNMAQQLVSDGHFPTSQAANDFLESALRGINVEGTDVELLRLFGKEPELGKVRRLADIEVQQAVYDTQIALKGKKPPLKEIWNKWGMDKKYGKYVGQNKNEVYEKIWEMERGRVRPMYTTYRDTAATGYKQAIDIWQEQATKLGGGIPYPDAEIGELTAAWNKAKKFDEFLDSRDVLKPLANALNEKDMKGVAIQFARMFRLDTIDASGAIYNDQKIINILNSQLKRKFTSLDDLTGAVGPQEIELALLSHAIGETVGIYQQAGAEGFDILRRAVSTLTDDIPIEDMEKVDKTLDVLRQVDEDLAKNIEILFKQRDYEMREALRKGRRMSEATRQESNVIVGEMQVKLEGLIDEAGQKLEKAGAIEPPTFLSKLDDPLSLSDSELDEVLEVLKADNPELWKEFGQAHAALKSEPVEHITDITKYPGGDAVAQRQAMDKALQQRTKAEEALSKATAKVKTEIGEEPQLRGMAEEVVQSRRQAMEEAGTFTADMSYYSGENMPGTARQWYERRGALRPMEQEFLGMVDATFGKRKPIAEAEDFVKNLTKAKKYTGRITEESRQISNQVAKHKRNFILHDYAKKRNFDLAMSYVMPYHFWYNRTYAAWLKRTVTHPGTMTAYLDYKDALQKMHADMPDWWKANISTNELLGIDSENPFYFNLEQTLNPLNGLTGLDFDDKDKSFSWFSGFMQDVGKYGPSVYTPIAWAIAGDAYRRGETEAMKKWAGRAIPQTQAIKALTAQLGLGPGGSGLELDPSIWLTQGGVDVWESGRIGRALGWAVDNGMLTEEQAQQAGMEGPGNPEYDNARGIAQSKRSAGQLSSFMFGTGFKARTEEDLEIDKMDDEFHRFMAMKDSMNPDDIAASYRYFADKYPFFNTLQITRRDEEQRDTAYSYSVLSRIPPGQTKEAYRAMGLEREQVNEFWDAKGIPEDWTERERINFVSAIQDVGTMLAIPKDATKDEWIEVKDRNKKLYAEAEKQFGEEVVELMDSYWSLYATDEDAAKQLRERNPVLDVYQDFLTMGKVNDPLLAKYYASYDQLRMMIQGMTYDKLDETYGPEFHAIYAEYNELRLSDPKAATKFYKAHPEIKQYKKDKSYQKALQSERLISFADKLPARTPGAVMREDAPPPEAQTREQAQIAGAFEQEELPEYYAWGAQEWLGMMSPALQSLVVDWAARNEELSYTAEQSLEYQLRDLDIDPSLAKQLIRAAIQGRR